MKGIVITSKGIEDIAAIEISELINAKCKVENSCVIFEFKEQKDICLLCYKAQAAERVLYLIGEFEFNNFLDEFNNFLDNLDQKTLSHWINDYKSFKVECIRLGEHNFKSVDVESKITEFITTKSKNKDFNIDKKNFEVIFFVYIVNNKCYFGIDFAGFELNKRTYKIFLHSNSLRGPIAYALIRESKFSKGEVLLDPFSRDGVIIIEAALYSLNLSSNYTRKDKFAFLKLKLDFDFVKFFEESDKKIMKHKPKIYSYDHVSRYVDYSKKNAKMAGVDNHINFGLVELKDIDMKFTESSVDKIITNIPTSKSVNLNNVYSEFFYQAKYVLKKDGVLALITKNPEFVKKHALRHDFLVLNEREVWSGQQALKIMTFIQKGMAY